MSSAIATPDEREDDYAIIVDHVSKRFVMHADRRDSLKERFVRGRSRHTQVFQALDDVSFKIPKGSTFGLIGHNGSGKSTMLKILAGVYRPTSGEVRVADKVDALLEVGAGFHGELTGRENIYLNGAILGRSRKEINASIDWIIDFADIGRFIDEPVKVYSSGMAIRLGFATAVAVDPSILIVDEVIAVGDEEFQRKCFALMRKLRAQGVTIALVTHSLPLAQEMCDQLVWLDHGEIREIGPANDVISSYLESVNTKENNQRRSEHDAGPIVLSSSQGKPGARNRCHITEVQLLDADDVDTEIVISHRKATIRTCIQAAQTCDQLELEVAFGLDNGTVIAAPTSKAAGVLYDIPAGDCYVDYTVDPLRFQAGSYTLTITLSKEGVVYARCVRPAGLIVRDDAVQEESGIVALPPGIWGSAQPVSTGLYAKESDD